MAALIGFSVVGFFCMAFVHLAVAHEMVCEHTFDDSRWDDVSYLQLPQALPDNAEGCGLELVSTFFTTKPDWQSGHKVPASFSKMIRYYQSARKLNMNVTILYDELSPSILQHANDKFKFVQVKLTDYDSQMGLNDVRFVILDDVVKQHQEWQYIFLTDLFDAQVEMNPCGHMSAGKLYTGSEEVKLSNNKWMEDRYRDMGGKYLTWFEQDTSDKWALLNAGIVGGQRHVFTQFLAAMKVALEDTKLKVRIQRKMETVNMAAFNYVIRKSMGLEENNLEGQPGIVTGFPVHSKFRQFEDREDVWFRHKF